MIGLLRRLLSVTEPVLSEASLGDAAALASLHAASFQRGWSDDEFEQLLLDRDVLAHRARIGRRLVGFIASRTAAGEAEILSIAVAAPSRSKGLGRRLLELHLRRLAGRGAHRVFLEVDEGNAAAMRLYRRAGFHEVGRRPGYYDPRKSAALVLRRDLF